jgi:GNAT superfamily N-acetyltransferase
VEIAELDPADEASMHRHWEIGRAADAVRPYDFFPTWEAAWATYSHPREDVETVLLGAYEDGEMWGAARVDHSLHDNLHTAMSTYAVHPARQRRGIGRALADASYDVARRRGRRVMLTETYAPVDDVSASLLFGRAMGFTEALVDGMKVVDLVDTEHLWDALEAAVAPRHTDYRIVSWSDAVPGEHVEGYCRLCEMFLEEAPMGALEVEAERWDERRLRARERRNAATGRHEVVSGAVAPDGSLVALTEVGVSEHAPHRGFQSGTIVDPAHHPGCRLLVTGNADVNAAMNSVNDALGYREVERCVEMQRPIG